MSGSSRRRRRSQEKVIVSRPEGPRSGDRSAATYGMRQRRQKEWKGGARQREQTARSETGKNPQQRSMPGDGGRKRARQRMLGSRARVFSHGVGAAGAVEGGHVAFQAVPSAAAKPLCPGQARTQGCRSTQSLFWGHRLHGRALPGQPGALSPPAHLSGRWLVEANSHAARSLRPEVKEGRV